MVQNWPTAIHDARQLLRQAMLPRSVELPDGVAAHQVDAVEIREEVAVEERAHDLVEPLLRGLEAEGLPALLEATSGRLH